MSDHKKTWLYEILNLKALKILMLYKNNIYFNLW